MPSIINVSNNTITSVNGQIGDVNLSADDVNALPDSTFIPQKTSDLENDTDFVSDKNYVHTDNNYTTEEKTAVGTIKDKVDKIDGMGLSANNLTDELKEKYDDAVNKSHTHNNKSVLDATTASYTVEEKNKLKSVEENAQKNVQSDWDETDDTKDNFLKNKPYIPSKTSDLTNDTNLVEDPNYVHTDNNYTDSDKISVSLVKDKVDKIDGKGLSTNDFTDELKQSYDDTVKKSHTHANKTILDGITASYTTEDKNKLSQVESDLSDEITRAKNSESAISSNLSSHINDVSNPHKVTKSQIGLGNVENKTSATIRGEITKDDVTTALGYTPYTPNEVDNKISALETNIDWKESVNTYDDIAATYPNPDDGWTVNVKDTDYTYRYNGTKWVAISANAIPKATNTVDGLLSKEDYTKYEDTNSKKHTHDNKSVLDGITSALITAWNNAVTHISDTVKHITSAERTLWNTVSNKVDKVDGKGLSTNDYTTAEKDKLNGIAEGANKTIVDSELSATSTNPVQNKIINSALNGKATSAQGAKADSAVQSVKIGKTEYKVGTNVVLPDYPTTLPASDVPAWAKESSKPSYTWDEINEKPSTFTPSSHTHSYNDLTNKPTIPSAVAVKGDAETTYRTGNVNLTPANLGAVSQKEFDELSIGGRNLLKGTKDFTGVWENLNLWERQSEKYKEFTVYKRAENWAGFDKPTDVSCINGEIYTYSFYAKSDNNATMVITQGGGAEFSAIYLTVKNEWERYAVNIIPKADGYLTPRISFNNNTVSNNWLYLCGLKLEKGNKATDWTPAPEDLVEESKNYTDTKVADYLPLSGGTLNGQLTWNGEAALPAFSNSPTYLLGIESFANGGTTKYFRADKTIVGEASKVNGHTVNSDVPSEAKFTDTWRPLGTTADTACAGNDSRLSNSRPASDVYSWAKQAKKPSYTASEVGAAAANHTHSNYMSSMHEVVSSSEPTNQSVGDYWIKRIK